MATLNERIDRTRRLLTMMEQQDKLLDLRLAPLTDEYRDSSKAYLVRLADSARDELAILMANQSHNELSATTPEAAD